MKIEWNNNDRIYTCSFCGYKYKEKFYGHPSRYTIDEGFGKEPFKGGINHFVYEEEQDYGPDKTVAATVYACPRCGILQIENETLDR